MPPWLRPVPAVKPRTSEPPLVGDALPALFRVGFPHIRFAADDDGTIDPAPATAEIFTGGWMLPQLLRPRGVWARLARAYAGNVLTLSSDPRRRGLTPEAKQAIADPRPIEPEAVPGLVRRLMTEPGTLRNRELTEDFVYALEALCGPEPVAGAIVDVLESPPPGTALPQMKPLVDDVALALGFVRLRLTPAKQKALDARLRAVVASGSKRYPIPRLRLTAFLDTAHPPRGAVVPDVLHTTDVPAILAGMKAFRPDAYPLDLLDPRLVFLAGADAIPLYLEKLPAYERCLHPNVAPVQLRAFVDAIAPFRDPRVTAWLQALEAHAIVGTDAKAWLATR
ncbi:Hypothetical protein I5071_72420 [Sandaracinus amylolyticus]|nr:Hypothetical protein I5071_72420 [Sandaracinus amylolyticus]